MEEIDNDAEITALRAVDWPSVRAQAQSAAIWASDPIGMKISMSTLNGTSATTLISSALYRDIPL